MYSISKKSRSNSIPVSLVRLSNRGSAGSVEVRSDTSHQEEPVPPMFSTLGYFAYQSLS